MTEPNALDGTASSASGLSLGRKQTRETLRSAWWSGVRAVDGYHCTSAHLARHPQPEPDIILAVGKAATAMSRAAAAAFGNRPKLLSVTKYGHADEAIGPVIEAGHPHPDENSVRAGQAVVDMVAGAGPDSRLMLLVSGGASALVEHPVDGLHLADIKQANTALLASGAPIDEVNAERAKFSAIKAGKLLARFPGQAVDVLAISDVAGDSLEIIGSGIGQKLSHTPFSYSASVIASNAHARHITAMALEDVGLNVVANEENLYGPLDDVCARIADRLLAGPPGAYVFGGEPTVVLPHNPGRGGRNQALGLALARALRGRVGISLLVAGTDGTDGPTADAGAFVDGGIWQNCPGGPDAIAAFDSGTWLERAEALFTSGPTGTNVMDLLIAVKG